MFFMKKKAGIWVFGIIDKWNIKEKKFNCFYLIFSVKCFLSSYSKCV